MRPITYEVTVYESWTEWRLYGVLHREDGAAIECADGRKRYYIEGKRLTEDEFNSRNIQQQQLKN
jgi:hypothetical protein